MRRLMFVTLVLAALLSTPAAALGDYSKWIGGDHPATSCTGNAGLVYTYGASPYAAFPVTSNHVRSIYMWNDEYNYFETGYVWDILGYNPVPDHTVPWIFTTYAKWPGIGNPGDQVQYFPHAEALNTWYNFQIYSYPSDSRTWRVGKNNTVHLTLLANFSAGQCQSSSERWNQYAYDRSSFHDLQLRYAGQTNWQLWDAIAFTDSDSDCHYVKRSNSSWYSLSPN